MSLAVEYKEKIKQDKTPSKYAKGVDFFWEYEKLINPKFFKEDRWHLKEIAITLQAFVEERIIKFIPEEKWRIASHEEIQDLKQNENKYIICKKLMMNIPPRHGKSYTLQLFEQWLLGKDNDCGIITVSYNDILAGRFSSNVRDGIEATKVDHKITIFSDIFPHTKIKYGDAAKNLWSLAGRFFSYLGTGFGGTITGIGCRLGVIDDPVKNDEEAYNQQRLENQYNWYVDTFLSRVEEGGFQIINMTRWSTKDLCGRLENEEPEEWYKICYPACMNADKVFKVEECQKTREVKRCKDCPGYPCEDYKGEAVDEEGNLLGKMLCAELLSFKTWINKRKLQSKSIFLANYQQQPVDVTGSIYAQGFKEYDPEAIDFSDFERICSYTDTADEGSDSLCSISFGIIDRYGYILDIYYTDEDMSITEKETARRQKLYKVKEAIVESNNGGRGFARNVESILKGWKWKMTNIFWFFQSKNKRARILSHASNVCEQIIMPTGWEYKWPEFYKHVSSYQRKGKNPHDDPEDCLTGVTEFINGEIKVQKKARVGMKSRLGL